MSTAEPLATVLGAFVAGATSETIPGRVYDRARISLIHNLCVAMAGRSRETVAARYAARWQAAPAEATLLASGTRVSAEGAAFANGALFHARSQDDTHPPSSSHPGAPVMAAALAVAETEDCSGRDFLAAVILGYEVLGRLGRDFDEQVSARGFRAAAVIGAFGAAAAAARLMRLDATATAAAIGFAAHTGGGLAQVWVEGSAEFPLQLGMAARNGVVAARLAAAGLRPAHRAIEGKAGFYNAYAGAKSPPDEALAGLGQDWQFDEVTTKPFPACAILQGPLELLARMRTRHGADARNVAALVLHLSPYEAGYTGVDNNGPRFASPAATKMSAQFCLAAMLARGRLQMSDLDAFDDPGITSLVSRVSVATDPALEPRQCRIVLRRTDGSEATETVLEPAGRPDMAQMSALASGMAAEIGWDKARIQRLIQCVVALDDADSVSDLLAACTAPATAEGRH